MGNVRQLKKTVRRRVLGTVQARLETAPVVAIGGPRSSGKSTVLAALASELGLPVVDLDDPATQRAVRSDPLRFLDTDRPVLIDEYARVPETMDVIKQLLNRDGAPGQFVLAGSTRYGSVPAIAQALTGRVDIVPLWPLSQGEITSAHEAFVERLVAGKPPSLDDAAVDRASYAERVIAGGMPIALRLPTVAARSRWFDQYLNLTLDKDVAEITKVRRRVILPRLAAAVARRTAQLLNMADLARDLGVDRSTTEDYLRLLEAVFLHHVLPAWGTTLAARAAATPKVHFVDSGLAARLLRVTAEKLLAARPSALQQFGHLLETFTINELCKQAHWLEQPTDIGHWRTHDGEEVDLVLERTDGSVLAFEVKAAPDVRAEDVRGIKALARRLGPDQVTGIVLHTGRHGWRIEANLFAVPIARIWSPV
ncbi:MAG TPA: ATP-binding protein [Planctomycetota bacterium]|nr:ATP-binding protein [Planctomycetota bacterium]